MIGVVVCDDHSIVRSGIRRIIDETEDLELLAAAASGVELLSAVRKFRPDVAVLDIRLADGSGLELLDEVLRAAPSTRVVMLSMYGAKGYVEKSRALGARAYLTKECLDDELIATLRRVIAEDGFVCPHLASPRRAASPRRQSVVDDLSAREVEVLTLLVEGFTNPEIAERLCVSPRTVESHRAGVQRKLGVRTRAELAQVAREAGLSSW